jgi:hypothetical protein
LIFGSVPITEVPSVISQPPSPGRISHAALSLTCSWNCWASPIAPT